jgi:hypothetical protein
MLLLSSVLSAARISAQSDPLPSWNEGAANRAILNFVKAVTDKSSATYVEPQGNFSGKPEDIYLFTGLRPLAAFGNSTGDQQMGEWTSAGQGARLMMMVLHDDADREYAYGPAAGLADTQVGTFTQALYDEATAKGWNVISMKTDWKRIFAFDAR